MDYAHERPLVQHCFEQCDDMKAAEANAEQGTFTFTRASDSTLLIKLSGPWHLTRNVPSAALLRRELSLQRCRKASRSIHLA